MAWGAKTQIATALSIAANIGNSSAVTLNPGELAHVQVEADFPVSPTDTLIVAVYGTLDATTENWDDSPIFSQEIDKDVDPNAISLVVSGMYKFRLSFWRLGSVDTITVNAWVRTDGVSL